MKIKKYPNIAAAYVYTENNHKMGGIKNKTLNVFVYKGGIKNNVEYLLNYHFV